MVGNCALGSQIAGGDAACHCDGYRALLGWLNEAIRREIMRGWREWGIGCSLSVGIRCTVSVQVLVAKTLASSRDSVVLYT